MSKKPRSTLEKAIHLFMKATQNDWRTVQSHAQQAITRSTASSTAAAEAAELMNMARSILLNENGKILADSGIDEP